MENTKRFHFIDDLRLLAIILMIIFHFCYDLTTLGFYKINFSEGFWYFFPRFITTIFLFCVGKSLDFSHSQGIKWPSFWKRFIKIALSALIISLATYFGFPNNWVYFGILHCIALGSLFTLPFVHRKKWAIIPLILIAVAFIYGYDVKFLTNLIGRKSMDFIPIYPWWFVFLIGLVFPARWLPSYTWRPWKPLVSLSRNSLQVYLIHQPVIFGSLILIKRLISS